MLSDNLLLEHRIGNIYDDCEQEYVIQLFGNAPPEDVMWVDFRIAEVIGHEGIGHDMSPTNESVPAGMQTGWIVQIGPAPADATKPTGRKFFNKRDSHTSPDPVYTIEEAELAAEGFVKWDGCTQFTMGHVHIDSREGLEALFGAIAKARELAASVMSTTGLSSDIRGEYEAELAATEVPK